MSLGNWVTEAWAGQMHHAMLLTDAAVPDTWL